MVKFLFCLAFIIVLALFSCGPENNRQNTLESKMKLTFEVIPEDFKNNLFCVQWDDTLGLSENYQGNSFIKRPQEVWCVITNESKDTLGYYTGLSTARTFAAFQSKDTVVVLNFTIGLNIFTDKFEKLKSKGEYERAVKHYLEVNKLPVSFEPIRINLKTDLRQQFDMELNVK